MTKLKIAIVGLSVESLIGSPLKIPAEEMQNYRGSEMVEGNLWLVRGILDRLAEDGDVEAVPLVWSTALPGGALTHDNYIAIRDEAAAALRANGPFDGVVVANHGALEVDGIVGHADADYVKAVRAAIGPKTPIAAALDLHGHMSKEFIDEVVVMSALRTAPHRDDRETGYRATDQLMRVIRTGIAPRTACVRVPILIAGEAAVTTQEPGRTLYAELPSFDSRPGIMEANIFVGFAFNDCAWSGMTAYVTSDGDAELAERTAHELALRIWDERHNFVLRMETASVEEGLVRAASSAARPVFVSDSGDNTTAGAPGDLTGVLQSLLAMAEPPKAAVPGILAPKLVAQALAAGVGAEINVELGAEHISLAGTRKTVTGKILGCGPELKLGGFQPYRSTEAAWASLQFGSVVATFHAQPIGITTPEHLEAVGVALDEFDVIVVKLGYLHPRLEDIAARHVLLLNEGAVSLDLAARPWRNVTRPALPVDPDFAWSPAAATYAN